MSGTYGKRHMYHWRKKMILGWGKGGGGGEGGWSRVKVNANVVSCPLLFSIILVFEMLPIIPKIMLA